ncbi:MAG: histidine kinase dimerization/phospho-acceptor domain-containing protein, partial [Anaerolineales bacterium]
METTPINIPTDILTAAKLTPDELKAELAVRLLQQGRISPEQARALAGEHNDQVERLLWRKDKKFDLDAFLDWASHDFKTPLNAVIGFTKVVLKGIDGPVNDMQVTDLTTAHTGGQRMLNLVSMLVDIARLNIGQIELNQAQGNIADLITEAAARWRTQNPAKDLVVDTTLHAPQIRYDNLRMRQ